MIKPYLTLETEDKSKVADHEPQQTADNAFTSSIITPQKGRFDGSRLFKFNGLMDRGVSTIVLAYEAKNNQIFGARLDDIIKYEELPRKFEKSRLVFQAYINENHEYLTYAPTVQPVS